MGKVWSAEEDAALRENYHEHGLSWDGWNELLDDRSKNAIKLRARKLKLFVKQHEPWTPEEDSILMDNYMNHGSRWSEWSELIPNRTMFAISGRARYLGLRTGKRRFPWTNKQRKELLMAYRHIMDNCDHSFDECVRELRRLKSKAKFIERSGGDR